jgi:hypothetical protein
MLPESIMGDHHLNRNAIAAIVIQVRGGQTARSRGTPPILRPRAARKRRFSAQIDPPEVEAGESSP